MGADVAAGTELVAEPYPEAEEAGAVVAVACWPCVAGASDQGISFGTFRLAAAYAELISAEELAEYAEAALL